STSVLIYNKRCTVDIYDGGEKMKREFAVIGLGRFGGSICYELSKEGMEVLAIDIDEDKVNAFKNIASHAIVADTKDEASIKEIGIKNIDIVIVVIGYIIKSSIMTTVLLIEFGVRKYHSNVQIDY